MKRKTCIISVFILFILAWTGFPQGTYPEAQSSTGAAGLPSLADLAEKVKNAVVNVSITSSLGGTGEGAGLGEEGSESFREFFKKFFGGLPEGSLKKQSLGSGFIIDRNGYVITNYHVVEDAQEIKVILSDGREFKAKVIGKDPKTDLALIKIPSPDGQLPVLGFGSSGDMRVGDWVIAVGSPFGLQHTVTQGIISAKGRVIGEGPYDNFLQTDAPINPGNSGGPLVNMAGEVIGINTAIIASGQGIGFAIPSDTAKNIITQLKERGRVIRGWIGITIQKITPEIARSLGLEKPKGALVADVVQGGPADKAGIRRGDVIISFDGKDIQSASELPLIVAETPVGKTVDMNVIRDGKIKNMNITVQEMTEKKEQRQSRQIEPSVLFGMVVENLTEQFKQKFGIKTGTGVVVIDVVPGSPADDAGIQPGDLIQEVNRKRVETLEQYRQLVKSAEKGAPILFMIKRGNSTFFVTMQVESGTQGP